MGEVESEEKKEIWVFLRPRYMCLLRLCAPSKKEARNIGYSIFCLQYEEGGG